MKSNNVLIILFLCLFTLAVSLSYYLYPFTTNNFKWAVRKGDNLNIIHEKKSGCENKIIGHYSWYLFISNNEEPSDGPPAVAVDPLTYKQYIINTANAWYFIDSSIFSWEYIIKQNLRIINPNDMRYFHKLWDKSPTSRCEEHVVFKTWVFKEINRYSSHEFYDILYMPNKNTCGLHTATWSGVYILANTNSLYTGTHGTVEPQHPIVWEPQHRLYLINEISKKAQETINNGIFYSWTVRIYDQLIPCGTTIFDFPYCAKKDINRCIGFIDIMEWTFEVGPIYR